MFRSDLYPAAYRCTGTFRTPCITLGLWPWIPSRYLSLPGPLQCRHSPNYTVVTFWKVRCKFELSSQMYMCVQGSPVEVRTPKQRKLINRMIVLPPMLSPSSIRPRLSSHWPFQHGEHWARFSKMLFYYFVLWSNKSTIISQIITLLHVSTLSCHPQTACNQYLAKLHNYFKYSCW
jgi:hypothetical protein